MKYQLSERSTMVTIILPIACAMTCLFAGRPGTATADDYRLETIDEPAPADALSPDIAKLLAPKGVRVVKGSSRTLCKIWLCKRLPVEGEVGDKTYPFPQGALLGVIQYLRDGGDFRDQEIPKGIYTMRYAHIPTDGAHEGVSPTPDFVLLVSPDADTSPEPIDAEDLQQKSADSIGSSHPAILALKPPIGDQVPALVHQEEDDWWLVQLPATFANGKPARLSLVVVGYTEE